MQTESLEKRMMQRPVMQDYRNRDYCQHLLDRRIFQALNDGASTLSMMTSGCLDALEQMPAGAMQSTTADYFDRSLTQRGQSAEEVAERHAFAKSLIDKILREKRSANKHN